MNAATLIKQSQQLYRTRAAWLGEGGQPSPHAQVRTNTCLQCPRHEVAPWEEFYKDAVAGAIKRQIELKGHLKLTVEGEEKLHLCGVCKCVLKLKVHVPLHIARANTPDWQTFPDNCWLRTEV